MPARRLASFVLLAASFSFFTGLIKTAHLQEAGPEHDTEQCQLCQALAAVKATTPEHRATVILAWNISERSVAEPVQAQPAREFTGDPVAPRAPPLPL